MASIMKQNRKTASMLEMYKHILMSNDEVSSGNSEIIVLNSLRKSTFIEALSTYHLSTMFGAY